MTQEFVTLPREVVKQALEALINEGEFRKLLKPLIEKSIDSIRAALEHPQNHVPDAENMAPAGWKLVPIEPTDDMLYDIQEFSHILPPRGKRIWAHMLAAAPQPPTTKESLVAQPQANQPAMTPIAQRKLEDLLAEGYTISGYSVYHERKHQHGFVTGAGLVGWWKPDGVEYPQQQGDPSTVAFCHVGDVVVCDNDSLLRQLGVKRSDKLYLHPQDLNCKSKQALLATLWGYTKEQPKREPLTDEKIIDIADDYKTQWVHGGQTYDQFDSMAFARAIEAAHNIK